MAAGSGNQICEAPPHDRRGTPKPQPKQALTPEARWNLYAAACERDWPALLQGVSDHRFTGADDMQARDELLEWFADNILAQHRPQWNRNIGALAHALGLDEAREDAQEPMVERDVISQWDFERGPYSLAHENAYRNLKAEAARRTKLESFPYSAERASIGWREAYTTLLATMAVANPDWFFSRLIFAPHLPGDDEASARRLITVRNLAASAGGLPVLAARLTKKRRGAKRETIIQEMWVTYAALAGKPGRPGKPGAKHERQVDAVQLLLGLLSNLNSEEWLAVQVIARDGLCCEQCGRRFTHAAPPRMSRVTPERKSVAKRPSDYVLRCAQDCQNAKAGAEVADMPADSGEAPVALDLAAVAA